MSARYNQIPLQSCELNEVRTDRTATTNQSDFDRFKKHVITNKIDEIFMKKVDSNIFLDIFWKACKKQGDFRNVEAKTIERLILGGEIDSIDQKWYGWEALHCAASAASPQILKVICDKLGPNKINTLTVLSENALHILLEHSKLAQSFNVACLNGQDLKMSKIINKEHDDVVECAKILIEAKIDINHTNFWNETPILIATKRRCFQVVELLLKTEGIDLDSCKDAVSGKTARELLKRNEDFKNKLPKFSGSKPQCTTLFQFLKAGDEEGFLKYNGGKIKEFVNSVDGDNKENSSCTLLQYCFRRGLILWYQDKRSYDNEILFPYQDITANRMVQVFCQSGMARCIQHLLDNGADINLKLRKFENGEYCLMQTAIIKGYYPVVALILGQNDTNLTSEMIKDMCTAMIKLLENKNTDKVDLNSLNNTLAIVLNRLIDSIDFNNSEVKKLGIAEDLRKLLETGVRIINKENLLLLLKFPGSLCWASEDNKVKTVLEEVDPEVLKAHLDDCVEQNEKHVQINYNSFIKNDSVQSVFKTFLSSSAVKEFLNHLVFKILTMRKWKQLRLQSSWCNLKYFDLNLIFYIVFYILLNAYILCKFNNVSNEFVGFLYISGFICLVIFIGKEVLQFVANFKLYLSEFNNCCEFFLIIFAIIVYSSNATWIDAVEVLAVLNSNLVLLMFLEKMPACAKFIIILQTIVFYLSYMLFYFIQFLAFAICFYILFSKSDQAFYVDLPNKLFETIILFTGNLDYMDTPWKSDSNGNQNSTSTALFHDFQYKEPFSKMIFITFVLFIAIILQNLLLGLLVTDISDLQKTVTLSEQVKRASFVVRLETFFGTSCMKFVSKIVQYDKMELKKMFNGDKSVQTHLDFILTVNDTDRKILTEDEKQNLDFILTKKVKRPNALKKLRSYIRVKMNERSCEGLRNEENKEIIEKLEAMEERITKNLYELLNFKKNN